MDWLQSIKQVKSGLLQVVVGEQQNLRRLLSAKGKKDYVLIRDAAQALIRKLDTAEACGGAWDDLVEASETANSCDFAAQREIFLDVVRLVGHHVDSFGTHRVAAAVLADSAIEIRRAQILTGADPIASAGPAELVGMARADRIGLARQLWVGTARAASNVIWIGYINNKLDPTRPTTIGQVTLLPADSLRGTLHDGLDLDGIPEAAGANSRECLDWLSEAGGEDLVIARIDLGVGPVGRAVGDGRRNIGSLLDLFGRTNSEWVEAGILLQFVDGIPTLRSRSVTPLRRVSWDWGAHDPVSRSLEAQDERIPSISFSDKLAELLELRKALRQKGTSKANVVSAAVRALELLRADLDISDNWARFAEEYFRARWIVGEAIREFTASLSQISDGDYQCWIASALPIEILEQALISSTEYDGSADYRKVCAAGVDVLNSLSRDWLPVRRLQRAARALSSSDAPALVNQYGDRFATYLRRLQRCRNSVTHSGLDCTASSHSVEWFARRLGILALTTVAEALALSEDPRKKLSDDRDQAVRNLQLLKAGNLEQVFV